MDKGEHIIGLFLVLAKAVDTVNHTVLLNKLTRYGIRGTALQRIHYFNGYMYLKDNKVRFNGINSTHRNKICGRVNFGAIVIFVIHTLFKCIITVSNHVCRWHTSIDTSERS